eukprot:9486103-Pyramimonas_sp.AAC.1
MGEAEARVTWPVLPMQARKKGPTKLCFFNFNFGVFEQWETDDEPDSTGCVAATLSQSPRTAQNPISHTGVTYPSRPPSRPEPLRIRSLTSDSKHFLPLIRTLRALERTRSGQGGSGTREYLIYCDGITHTIHLPS